MQSVLRLNRQKLNLAQKCIAIESGIPLSSFCRLEKGRNSICLARAEKVAQVIGLPLNLIFQRRSKHRWVVRKAHSE